ncbi:uncharacterized protein LOC123530502 isoform X2 [Mercenaria mercenaria]|uniref:uncharacterized protein LOC123530502 isoform X2 n=1 Tax=Mercenaria mercenaria TaxID=6596 RepID=UPI00234E6E22|nr:uncharacterized protein LOC123530502 isoform X2 [Mercenaria mercenaria]
MNRQTGRQTEDIIHTASPSPDTSLSYEERKCCLKKSYLSCLEIVKQSQQIRTLAFPCLGSGGGGIQLPDAITTAVTTIRQWLETEDNLTQVESIILVMYDENQWNDYRKELFKTFPYGKDIAGIDMETLVSADRTTILGFVPQTAISTNILCYQYNNSAVQQVGKHLHSIVNWLQRKLGTRSEPAVRYRNCGTFLINEVHKHRVVVYHGVESCTLEIQIISYSDNPGNFQVKICEDVQSLIDSYLITNLENVTKYKTYIRCDNTSWGDTNGMTGIKKLKRKMSGTTTIQCRHRKSGINMTHSINLNEMTKFWIYEDQSVLHREPGEHNECADESEDSISWPSLVSISSSESGGKSEQKLDNIIMETGPSARIPVEHLDEIPNTFSKVKDFVKGKFQLFTKSNKDTTDTVSETEINSPSSNYQPINDSLLLSECKQLTKGRELGENTNIYSRHHSTDSLQAWEPGGHDVPEYQSHKQTSRSGQNGSSSKGCGNNSQTSVASGKSKQTESRRNSQSSTGNGQNRTSQGSNYSGDCEIGQSTHEGCTSSLTGELNVDSLCRCGASRYGYKTGPQSNNYCSSEKTSLDDKTLLNIARMIGNRETQLGLELGLAYESIQRIKSDNFGDAIMQAFNILREWKIKQRGKGSVETLLDAMTNCSIDTTSLTTFR